MTDRPEINFGQFRKQALIDALRNAMLGPSNISHQDKGDLIAIAERAYRTMPLEAAQGLVEAIKVEDRYRRGGGRSLAS